VNPKIRNGIAEAIAVLGILYAAIPSWSAAGHTPPWWVGLLITLLVSIGNQLLKDSTPSPCPSATTLPDVKTPSSS
jgi:hypothetical protein